MLKNDFYPKPNEKIVIVGGCGGIGKTLVETCLELEMQIAILDLPRSIEENPIDERVKISIKIDATNEIQVKNAFQQIQQKWNNFEYLVVLSGFATELTSVANLSVEQFDEGFEGNFKSTFLTCREAIPYLTKSIVTISSAIGNLGNAGYLPYSTSKIAIQTLTKTLAKELAPKITVNCVAPGPVNTPFLSKGTGRGGKMGDKPERIDIDFFKKLIPLGRIAEPEDIVGSIIFLLSDAAKYITGQVIHVNGGAYG